MRVVRNIGYVKRRKRLARWSALGGFAMLGATFWLALEPSLILLAYVPLLVGTLVFHFGMQQIAKWSRNPRNDVLLDSRLQQFPDKYELVHYASLGKRTVEHMLLHPGGVLVLTVRELPGQVVHRNGRWRKRGAGLGRLFGMGGPQLGNPTYQTETDVEAVRRHLQEAGLEVEVDGAIVFINPLVELDVEEPDFPVMNADGLPEFVRTLPVDASLRPPERQALSALLSQGEEIEAPKPTTRRRPVRKRAA